MLSDDQRTNLHAIDANRGGVSSVVAELMF
jgi:hypothetical protein